MSVITKTIYKKPSDLKLLLEAKGDANQHHQGTSALHYAVANLDTRSMSLLIQHKANVNALSSDNQTPLFFVTKEGAERKMIYCVALLIKSKADVNLGCSPLGKIISQVHNYKLAVSIVQLLLDAGAKTTPEIRAHSSVVISYRRLRNSKHALLTCVGVLKKRLKVCKDMINVICGIVWETRYDQVWTPIKKKL